MACCWSVQAMKQYSVGLDIRWHHSHRAEPLAVGMKRNQDAVFQGEIPRAEWVMAKKVFG